MAFATAGPAAARYTCPTVAVARRPSDDAPPVRRRSRDRLAFVVVRSGGVWEVRDAQGVVSWAQSHDEALAEAARHQRRGR